MAIEVSDARAVLVATYKDALELGYAIEVKRQAIGVAPTVMTEFIDRASGQRVSSRPWLLGGGDPRSLISVDYVIGDFFIHYRDVLKR